MSICDKCVHREVCCDEGMGEEALNFCAHLLEERPKGKWTYIGISEVTGLKICKCSVCNKRTYGSQNFCPNCGADMRSDV